MLPAVAVPSLVQAAAAAAAWSYLDAKYLISNDFFLMYPFIASQIRLRYKLRKGKLNLFHGLEDMALSSSESERNRVFIQYEGRDYTYAQSYELVLKYATWLQTALGVKSKDIVAMDFTNKPEFVWLWMGLWALGAVPAFINYNLASDRLVHCVKAATSSLLLVDCEIASVLDDEATRTTLEDSGKRKIVIVDDSLANDIALGPATRPDDSVRNFIQPPDPALLIYTSGTTGMPKPAVVSWHKLHHAGGFAMRWMGLRTTDRFYTSMPLYHSSAAVLGVSNVLQKGATVILGHKFSSKRTIPELIASKATIFQYVGETCRYLLASPPSPDDKAHNLRMAFGNGLRPDVWKAFKTRFNIPIIAEFYAATEGHSGSWNFQRGEFGIGAIGLNGKLTNILLGGGTKIVKLDYETETPARDPKTGFCTVCASDEPGEVIYKLDPADIKASFVGYYGNEKASNQKIMRSVFAKDDAWYRTGDIQRRDADGLWYFIDRIGDTFRWKSENVSTAEVENVIDAHPDVDEAVVYGISLPSHDGRCGCAAIVLHPGVNEDRFMAAFPAHVESLPRFARPLFVRFLPDIEKTGNNKHVKQGYKEDGVDLSRKSLGDVWWCPKIGDGYRRFREADWNEIAAGRVKL